MTPEVRRMRERRRFIKSLAVGATAATLAGIPFVIAGCSRGKDELRPDGRRRLPPGQRELIRRPEDGAPVNGAAAAEPAAPRLVRVDATTRDRQRLPNGQTEIPNLRPMGGRPGDPSRGAYSLHIHGLVEKPTTLSFDELLALPQVEQKCDVHCVTGWSVLGVLFRGVRFADLAALVKPTARARHVIFEAAHGYTANIDLAEAMKPNSLITWELNGRPLAGPHGAPVRNLLPDRYFWKSAKWLTGIRFVEQDERGFWEVRGYHNHGCPWLEERYAHQEG